jgi:acyl-coenzyme A synthetase/AMP-(fatty) acid ligase
VSADGWLEVTGPVIKVINHGGDKISPQAIEGVLLAQPGIVDAAAVGVPDAEGMMQIWAAVVVQPTFDECTFRRACSEKLRDHGPKFLVKLDALPRNAGGKVVRDELVRMVLANRQPA